MHSETTKDIYYHMEKNPASDIRHPEHSEGSCIFSRIRRKDFSAEFILSGAEWASK